MTTLFYDTSSLLLLAGKLFDEVDDKFAISSITLEELENIKTSNAKNSDIKFAARQLLRDLDEHHGEYDVVIFKENMLDPAIKTGLSITNDIKILMSALAYDEHDEVIFITNDLCLKNIANLFFGDDSIGSIPEEIDDYSGYCEVNVSDEDLSYLYTNMNENVYNLYVNEYLLLRSADGQVIDRLYWNGTEHKRLNFSSFRSTHFGDVRPAKDDSYQMMAMDTMSRNKISLVKGPAGSGKTYLAMSYLFSQLERHKIDKIIVFCNTLATKNSAKLGYLPGTKDEKLLDSQIGNLLSSKLGDKVEVERLIEDGKLVLLPFSDIRGYDTTGMNAGIYISEAQNLDVSLMKLALQRIGEDSICIIDGDNKCQVDDVSFEGVNNGMRRASKIFRGADFYGEVELKMIHRSKIAQLAEKM